MAENHDVALESEITDSNPATITVAGMSVCKNPACAAIVLHISLRELTGIDDEDPLHE